QIHLAGEDAAIAVASVEMEHDGVVRVELTDVEDAVPEKIDLAQVFRTAVEPGIDAPGVGLISGVRGRHHQTIGLHAAIDLRNVTAHHGAGGAGPGSVAMRKLV